MRKIIICLLALVFSVDLVAYAAGPAAGYGARGGHGGGSGNTQSGSGYGGRPGGYSGSGNSYQGRGGSYGSHGYHGTGKYQGSGGHGYNGHHGGYPYRGYPYRGHGGHNHGHGNSYSFWIGGGWPGYWGPAYPRYYSYYPSYPYYYPYSAAPGVTAEQPQLSSPSQDQDYWYYCQDPQGYYPYIKSCPGGWMKVVPEPAPSN